VSAEDIRRILQEMGPVEGAGPEEPETPPAPEPAASSVKVLRRRIQGSSIAGVCTGLADYFGVDVLIARLAFVALALMTGGVGVLLYVIMAFVVPADSASAAPPIVAGARALSPKTITVIAIACLLLAVFYAIVSVGGRSHMPGLLELLIGMLLSFGFFGTIAAILVGLAFIVIRFLRSATR
jgi:phage shock protein PspC (stress-responsive transcriptional regulator)